MRKRTAAKLHLKLVPHQCLEALKSYGHEVDWHTLVARLNLGLVVARRHFPMAETALSDALDAMVEIRQRADFFKRWSALPEQVPVIGEALNLTDEMETQVTRNEFKAAWEEVLRLAAN